MAVQRHHGYPAWRDFTGHSVERLREQGALAEHRDVLLRALIAAHPAGEASQPHSLPAGEHDAPELTSTEQRSRFTAGRVSGHHISFRYVGQFRFVS
jgi:hypothetical protein